MINCIECGDSLILKNGKFGQFYGCINYPKCIGSHGVHKDGEPLGNPADSETKQARISAHEIFDKLWKNNYMTRDMSYNWMQKILNLSKEDAHIAKFSKDQCIKLEIEVLYYMLYAKIR